MSVISASPNETPSSPPDSHLLRSSPLTMRERAVLRLLMTGMTDKEIAHVLGIGRPTASKHVQSILRKLGVSSRVGAVAIAARNRFS